MSTVELSGPLFSADVSRLVDATVRDIQAETLRKGESLVEAQLTPGHGLKTGSFKRSVHGRMRDSQHGTLFTDQPAKGAWLEGVSSLNQRTRFKGYALFRKATRQLDREADRIAERRVKQLVGRLS